MELDSALLIAGDSSNPSRVHYSAGVDKVDSFLIGDGGGFVDISRNSNDGVITGIGKFQAKAIIFKERSIWGFDFTSAETPSIQNLKLDLGGVSHRSIVNVENDLFFLGQRSGAGGAVYVLGYEPNIQNELRTNELSVRVRPELQQLIASNYDKASAVYYDNKVIFTYTAGGGNANNAAVVYDRERLGWTKWDNINVFNPLSYRLLNGTDKLLYVDASTKRISELSDEFVDDKGSPIEWSIRTKEVDLGDPFITKIYKDVYMRLRNVGGSVNISLWSNSNEEVYTYQVTLSSGLLGGVFGVGQFGAQQFGDILENSADIPDNIIIRKIPVKHIGNAAKIRGLSVEIAGDTIDSKAALLDMKIQAITRSREYVKQNEIINL